MRKVLVATLVLFATFVTTTSAFAQDLVPYNLKPLDLTCPLCGIKRAPDVVETQKPAELHPIRPGLVSLWFFVSYGRNAGTRGPFSSRVDCETARQLLDDTDRCFVERRYRYID